MRQGNPGTVYYLLGDHLGSTAKTYNAVTGATTELRYHPWAGTRYTDGVTPTSYQFTGQRNDAATYPAFGLYFYNARSYDPCLNRFISPDTIIPDPANPQSLNRYSYTLNNPLKYTDPTGHACDPLDGMNGGGGAVAGVAVIKIFEALSADGDPTNEVVAGAKVVSDIAQAVSADGDPTNEVQTVVNTLCGGDCSDEAQVAGELVQRSAQSTNIVPRLVQGTANNKMGLNHIVLRHWHSSGISNVSKFGTNVGLRELRGMISQFAGDLTLWTREGNSLVRIMDMGQIIGTDPTGQATSWMQVVINQAGEVITAYPIASP